MDFYVWMMDITAVYVYYIGRIVMLASRGLLKREPKAEPPPIVQFQGYY